MRIVHVCDAGPGLGGRESVLTPLPTPPVDLVCLPGSWSVAGAGSKVLVSDLVPCGHCFPPCLADIFVVVLICVQSKNQKERGGSTHHSFPHPAWSQAPSPPLSVM